MDDVGENIQNFMCHGNRWLVGLLAGQADPTGEALAERGNQEMSRWDPAGHVDNQPWITFNFSSVN